MRYDTEEVMKTYEITEEEAEVAQSIYDKRNTLEGEEAIIELLEMILERDGPRDILFDVCADWSWDYQYTDENIEKMNELWDRYD